MCWDRRGCWKGSKLPIRGFASPLAPLQPRARVFEGISVDHGEGRRAVGLEGGREGGTEVGVGFDAVQGEGEREGGQDFKAFELGRFVRLSIFRWKPF